MRRAVVTSILLSVLVFAFACDRFGSTANTSNGTSNHQPPDSQPGTDPRAEIETAARKFLAAKAYRGTAVGEGAMPMRVEIEYVAPDRYRIKTGPDFETLVIGDESYTRSGGRWAKLPMKTPFQASVVRDMFTEDGLTRMIDLSFLGKEALAEQPVLVYGFRIPAREETPAHSTRLWIRQADGLPMKGVVTFDSGPVAKITLEYEYPADLAIEPPVN